MATILDKIQHFWDADAHTYDQGSDHVPRSPVEQAAWSAALRRLLPRPPARVLDAGAGTGFLTLALARLGYEVTALDISAEMLSRLRRKADAAGLSVATVQAPAHEPPGGGYDAVIERHLLWTLPDPAGALAAWHSAVVPAGRLVLFEALWGDGADPPERFRRRARTLVRRLRREPSSHHGEYDAAMRAALPLGSGPDPRQVIDLVESTVWGSTRIERLRDIEWAATRALPYPERLIGVPVRFAITAGG